MDPETRTEIIEATDRALCEHGYAGLTMQRIAAESSMTTAAIHYHFDTKEELLNAFLDDLIERFEAKLACPAEDPGERLDEFLDAVFSPADPNAEGFPVALMELKAQAPYNDHFRERFLDLDASMQDVIGGIIAEGIEQGSFEEWEPQAVARLVTTMINGAHVRMVALGEPPVETRRALERMLERSLRWTPESTVFA